ncbi:MAG: D-alanine--D-alanine ligase [Planctomycetota bacterium]|nr:D-alanine--D-alanine ligase [Planctomycetota bacterium]
MRNLESISVLMGGPDAEREVSLHSGDRVATALETFPDLRVERHVIDRPDGSTLRDLLDRADPDVVFPVLHGPWGEGGPLQRLLQEIGRPYVGCGPESAALAMDKIATKRRAAELGLPTPQAATIGPNEQPSLEPPFVIKPVDEGSSVGVRVVERADQCSEILRELRARHEHLMAETWISGRELTVGIVGDRVLPIIEILPAEGFYDFEAKYRRDDTGYQLGPTLPPGLEQRLATWSRRIHDGIGARDLSRVDWLLGTAPDGTPEPWFLEVNTLPGMTDHSLVPMGAEAIGLPMPALCRTLAESALRRG